MKRKLAFDIETDGIFATKVHCIVAIDIDTNEQFVYRSDRGNLDDFRDLLLDNNAAINNRLANIG